MVGSPQIFAPPSTSDVGRSTSKGTQISPGSENRNLACSKCIFSTDVEDWFHILGLRTAPNLSEWDGSPSHVQKNFLRLLAIFAEAQVNVTCFFLGWIALKFPDLVKEAHRCGHEIASHGYAHRLVYEGTAKQFYQDALKSKKILEDTIGCRIIGYRAAGFSVTENTPWFFEKLVEAGYTYDSSVFPARRGHGGLENGQRAPHVVWSPSGKLFEFPITVKRMFGWPLCCFGGGYLRLFPISLIRSATRSVLREGRPVIFYVHPREIDPNHPRLPMGFGRKFKSYVNLKSTEPKIRRLLEEFSVTTFENYISEYGSRLAPGCRASGAVPSQGAGILVQEAGPARP
jgi:polysaccharide deacetylase family protein (PEP-CTERM system associated)